MILKNQETTTYQEREQKRKQMRKMGEEQKLNKKKEVNPNQPLTKKKEINPSLDVKNKEFARITYVFITLFLCMIGYVTYFQVMESGEVINSPYNTRQDIMAANVVRGEIQDRNGVTLAETLVAEDGSEIRYYPYAEAFAHIVGYSASGKSGVELLENFTLLTSNAFFAEKIANEFSDSKNIGDNVITTLDSQLQQIAYEALGDYSGGIVVMEPDTGKILVMVSTPGYDPNTVLENWSELSTSEDSLLLNRATQSKLVPGSIYKTVTALEYMRENPDYESYTYCCEGYIEVNGIRIQCYNETAHGEQTIEEAFANSCNCAFVDMGLTLDNDSLNETAESLLFNTTLPGEISSTRASFVLDSSSDTAEIMMTAIGQGNTLTSPYHMALITAAIANGGNLMTPYLIDSIENYTGSVEKQYSPRFYETLMTANEAEVLTSYMEAVIESGTGSLLSGQSYTVAGKTGTAEYSSDKSESHSWFTGFTNVDNPDIVVSVVVEESDGGLKAIEVAKAIMDAYYK